MRRLVFPTIVAIGLVMVGSSSASADDPTPAPTVSAKATPGKKLCKIADTGLSEISGLAATKSGFVVVNDGKEDNSGARIHFLDRQCTETKKVEFASDPRDPEDIVLSPDGKTLWIADTGDNGVRTSPPAPRPSVVLWSVPVDGKTDAVLHRLTYPKGDQHDAEALIFDGDGLPLIVTKEIGGPTAIYKPSAALKKNNETGVPLKRVGELNLSATETAGNPVARIGNRTVTGGAVTQGLTKVVLRTYTDALEWDVTGGDVLGALKKEPRTTGLPNETLGEAIAYSTDGKLFYTISDMSGVIKDPNHIREYTPATTVAKKSDKQGNSDSGSAWYLDTDNLAYAIGGVGLFGLILVGAGIFGIVRFRRSPAALAAGSGDAPSGGLNLDDPETELIGVGGAPQRGASYGAGRPGAGGPVYGAQSGPASGGQQRGNGPVYGAGGGKPGGGKPGGPGAGKPGAPGAAKPAGSGGQYGRPGGPQQPARGPQQAPRNPQQPAPSRGGQQPPRGPQQPARGPQQPARGPQQQPPGRGGQQAPPPSRGGQQAPPPSRGGQQAPPPSRGGQQAPPPSRGGQQPPRGPQQQPRGPQPQPRGPQQGPPPGRGLQQGPPPGRGPQQGLSSGRGPQPGGGVYGGQQPGGGVYGGGPVGR